MSRTVYGLLAGVALGALAPQMASAADMPLKAAPPIVAPVWNWTGFYVGANLGYGWGNGDTDVIPLPTAAIFVNLLPQTLNTSSKGVLGGGQFGYNWQFGSWVAGLEADFQGADMKGTVIESPIIQNNGTPFPGAGNNITLSQKLDWFGTARARLGTTIVNPNLLLFATGGFAFGHVAGTANTDFRPVGTEQYPASISSTRTGWAAGAGAEWAFSPRVSAKAEYLHVDLGSASVTANPVPPLPPFGVTYNFKTTADIFRVGVNFKLF